MNWFELFAVGWMLAAWACAEWLIFELKRMDRQWENQRMNRGGLE